MPEPTPPSPEILAQIRALPSSSRPLIVCDVDEVILHMALHLEEYMVENDLIFLNEKYSLTGNIGGTEDRVPLPDKAVRQHLQTFFDTVCHRQDLVDGAAGALALLADDWDIVLLTNLPGEHNKPLREAHLRDLGISYPVLVNSGPKGGAVAALSGGRPVPVVFIDDSPVNHGSVHASLPSAVQIQFIASERFAAMIEPADHIDLFTGDWQQTLTFISGILNPAAPD